MRNRITIQTTEELDQALEATRLATARSTKSEVIRDGLELYDLVVQHLIAGKHLYLGMTRESAGEVLLPHLERAAGRLRPSLAAVKPEPVPVPLAAVPTQSVASPSEKSGARRRTAPAEQSAKRRLPTDSLP